jgi:hypothetical protein
MDRSPSRTARLLLIAAAAASLTGCEVLSILTGDVIAGDTAIAPVVQLADQEAHLTQYPSLSALAKYSCQKLLGTLPCLVAGTPPSREELEFRFQVVFRIENPNRVPVPATELLVGLRLWPAETYGDIGAVCTTLCQPGAVGCPIPAGAECVDNPTDVRDLDTFLEAALRGAIGLAWDLANGQDPLDRLAASTVAPGATLDITFTFRIGIDPMLNLIQEAGSSVLIQYLQNGNGELTIPYAVGGKLWFQVPYLGRVAVGIGPFGAPPDAPLVWKVL